MIESGTHIYTRNAVVSPRSPLVGRVPGEDFGASGSNGMGHEVECAAKNAMVGRDLGVVLKRVHNI